MVKNDPVLRDSFVAKTRWKALRPKPSFCFPLFTDQFLPEEAVLFPDQPSVSDHNDCSRHVRHDTTPSDEEEAGIGAFRCGTLLPRNDRRQAVSVTLPYLPMNFVIDTADDSEQAEDSTVFGWARHHDLC